MKLLEVTRDSARPISELASAKVSVAELGRGAGEAHISTLRFEPGASIARHPAGFGQLLVIVSGSGWVAGEDDVRVPIRTGQAAYFRRHECHSKGSDEGMTALMIQVRDFEAELQAGDEGERE